MKRLLCCIMALTMIGSATAFAAEPVDNSAIAEKALSEVTALYEDLYTITNAEAEVQNSTYDDMGNTKPCKPLPEPDLMSSKT